METRKGKCNNPECELCLSREIQELEVTEEFVCRECGKPLKELESKGSKKKKSNKKLPIIIASAVVVVGAAIGGILALSGGSDEPVDVEAIDSMPELSEISASDATTITADTVVVVDTVVQDNTTTITEKTSTKTVVNTTSTQAKSAGSGSLSLSYGKYSGATKKGYAHGQGRLTYTTTRVINKNDTKQRTAQAGDYVIGEFFNGFVVYGKHYNAAGDLIESLNFGVGSEDSYDSK